MAPPSICGQGDIKEGDNRTMREDLTLVFIVVQYCKATRASLPGTALLVGHVHVHDNGELEYMAYTAEDLWLSHQASIKSD